MEKLRRDGEHRQIDQPGEPERDEHIHALEPEHAPPLALVAHRSAALRERRVEVDGMRHDRRADDADGEIDRRTAREMRDERVAERRRRRRPDLERLVQEAEEDEAEKRGDRELEAPVAVALQLEDGERDGAGHEPGRQQRDVEEEVEPERRAEELRNVGRHRHQLGLHPQRYADPARIARRGRAPAGCWPVTMPSFADRYWMSIAMRFAASTTQSRR